MSAVLHLVQRPDRPLVGSFAPGDAVVFMGQSVAGLASWSDAGSTAGSAPGVSWHALQADCELFGVDVDALPQGFRTVDYPGLVDLVVRYPLCQSW